MSRSEKKYFSNEKGLVLIVTLLITMVLVLLVTTAMMTTTTDLKITGNYKSSEKAFYAAEAGLEEARTRIRGINTDANYTGDPASSPNVSWGAYILTSSSWQTSDDPGYNSSAYNNYFPTSASHTNTTITANSLQSTSQYFVRIRHTREYDAERDGHSAATPHYSDNDGSASTHSATAPGNIIYYGFQTSSATTPSFFTSSTTPSGSLAKPVEIIRSYGRDSGGGSKGIEIQVKRITSAYPAPAAIYGDTIGGGGTVEVDGRDNCGAMPDLPALAYVTTQTLCGGGSVECYPVGNETVQVSALNLTDRVNALKAQAQVTVTADKTNYTVGTPTDYKIVYCDATALSPDQEIDFQNLTGYGILVVKGDLYFSGNLAWHGLIIASGNTSFYGGGADAKNVYGAVFSQTTATLQGKVNIQYDSCEIDKALAYASPVIIKWKEDSGP